MASQVHAGYNYHAPSTSVIVPNVISNINDGHAAPHIDDSSVHPTYSTVSYSVSHEDYNYLEKYKNGHQDPQYTKSYHTPQINHHSNNYHEDNYSNGNRGYYTQSNVHSETLLPAQHHTVTNFNTPGYVNVHHVSPVVTKHIYFHVPPPDMEEKPLYIAPPSPPKKVYNILFVKVPSQDSRNAANLQNLLVNRQASIEDKTLIYVLVKKPEPQPPVLPVPKISKHEVFYVKYKANPIDAVAQINSELSHIDSAQNPAPEVLQPGLVNGNQLT